AGRRYAPGAGERPSADSHCGGKCKDRGIRGTGGGICGRPEPAGPCADGGAAGRLHRARKCGYSPGGSPSGCAFHYGPDRDGLADDKRRYEERTEGMKERLDILLVKRNLAPSREKAKAVIMAGNVYVDGQKEDKAGSTFPEDAV